MYGLGEAQSGIKIAGRNINNIIYGDDTTLMAESKEKLKSLLMKVKEESEKAGFRKGRETRDPIANVCWLMEKARELQKNIYFCFIDYAKAFDCVDHNKCGKFWKRWEYQTT